MKEKLEAIFKIEDPADAAVEIAGLVWDKVPGGEDLTVLKDFERDILYLDLLEGQVLNGGFDQYFFNSSGEFAHETLATLQNRGLPYFADLLEKAIKLFPVLPIPKNTMIRRDAMEEVSEKVEEQWDNLDDLFYEKPHELSSAIVKIAKSYMNDF
ncbi:MAG: DMP19 family protein [bacterium]|nr:DMP19 family protein [bacterium]